MDLIDDLENDLALAFLVEKKQKIDSHEALALIGKIKEVLKPDPSEENVAPPADSKAAAVSH